MSVFLSSSSPSSVTLVTLVFRSSLHTFLLDPSLSSDSQFVQLRSFIRSLCRPSLSSPSSLHSLSTLSLHSATAASSVADETEVERQREDEAREATEATEAIEAAETEEEGFECLYVDDKGDALAITNEIEWCDALQHSSRSSHSSLRLYLLPTKGRKGSDTSRTAPLAQDKGDQEEGDANAKPVKGPECEEKESRGEVVKRGGQWSEEDEEQEELYRQARLQPNQMVDNNALGKKWQKKYRGLKSRSYSLRLRAAHSLQRAAQKVTARERAVH